MHGNDTLKDIRALEYFLFGGVPAQPEPMYSRGEYYLHAAIRQTRYPGEAETATKVKIGGEVTGIAKFNVTTKEITILDRRQSLKKE